MQESIGINGVQVMVRKNLYEFLARHLYEARDQAAIEGKSLLLPEFYFCWIDALCIDQSNVAERNHQVQLMKDIYSKVCCTQIFVRLSSSVCSCQRSVDNKTCAKVNLDRQL
jgi:hypothetical protein